MIFTVTVVALLTAVCVCMCWDLKEAATLASLVADRHGLSCLSVRYPPGRLQFQSAFQLAKLLSADPANLRTLKVTPMDVPSTLKEWSGCSQVLTVLLVWWSSSHALFPMFLENALIDDPVWLILLPKDLDPPEFFQDDYLPFQARVLTAVPSVATSIRLTEVWRVAERYPLRTAHYAVWKDRKLLCPRAICTFHPRKDLEGAPLRATTKDDWPIASLLKTKTGDLIIGGYFGAVFYEIASQINSTAVVVAPLDNMTGSERNGTWNGLIGMMIRSETDLAVGPMTHNNKVSQVTSFLPPLLRTNYQVFFKQDGTVVEWDAFLKPFGRYVWRVILVWFIVGTIAYNYCYKTGCRLGIEDIKYLHEFSKLNSFLTFFKAFCGQGTNLMPQSLACRGLHLTGYVTSAIILTAYSASLISKLTLQEPLRPFDSLESFLEDGSYSLSAIARSTDYTYFSEATNPLLRQIYEKTMIRLSEKVLPRGKEDGVLQVCQQHKQALFITFAVSQITAKRLAVESKCPILWFRTPLGTVFLTIGVRKNMPYTRLISSQLHVMAERGITKRLMRREWPLEIETKQGAEVTPPELELKQVAQIYCILGVGAALAVIILLLEMASVSPNISGRLTMLSMYSGCNEETAVTIVLFTVVVIVLATVLANCLE